MYIVVRENGKKPQFDTLRTTKSKCISTFLEGSELPWKVAKKNGWKCIKVQASLQPINNIWV